LQTRTHDSKSRIKSKFKGMRAFFFRTLICNEYIFRILKKNSKKKIHKSKVLVIGDNLNTDISGANNFNVKNLFIAGGIHKPEWSKKNISLANFVIEKNKYFKINYFQNELIW
ncbi:MAG: HAD hydrolase-like protein, partial [Candidatus Fonsibacter sp.]